VPLMFVFKAAVVGAGTMGGEIAQAIAAAGIPVVLKDVDRQYVETGLGKARSIWQAKVDAGKLDPAERDRQFALIDSTTTYDGFGDVDFVIEAVPERIELKQQVMGELDEVTPGHAILASNTSALSITEIADATMRPDKVVGFHFFYPASTARLIEVVEGEYTSPETAQAAATFAQAIRKTPIRCGEAPGFVVNRILNASVSEIWRLQEETGVTPEEIDRILTGMDPTRPMPTGPFRLGDLLGLDTVLHVAEHLYDAYGDRFHVHEGMRRLVRQGNLGRKTGKGFYEYDA
jgi:3-hydroxyacyl-CoA dehydrogenase